MQIDVNKLEKFMEVVNAKVDPNKDTYDAEFAALAESSKQAITQYNVEVNMGLPQRFSAVEWVSDSYRQQQQWPQRLWRLYEAYQEQQARDETASGQASELAEALAELRKLREEVAELKEAKNPPVTPEPEQETPAETDEEAPVEEA